MKTKEYLTTVFMAQVSWYSPYWYSEGVSSLLALAEVGSVVAGRSGWLASVGHGSLDLKYHSAEKQKINIALNQA